MNVFFAISFIILAAGIAFALRGIWGHQIGGWVMGVAMALGIGVILALDMATTVTMGFWLAIAWAAASFVGWANHGAGQRFIRGFLAYGALPGVTMALILFPDAPATWLVAAAAMGLPTGAAFALSGRLICRLAERQRPGTTSAWRYGMEYPAGFMHGAGIAAFLAVVTALIVPVSGYGGGSWSGYHVLFAAVAIGCALPACAWKVIVHRRELTRSSTGESLSISSERAIPPGPLLLAVIAIVSGNLALSIVMLILGSVSGLFCTHIISAGAVGSLYEKHTTPGARIDVVVTWIAILASAVLAWLA